MCAVVPWLTATVDACQSLQQPTCAQVPTFGVVPSPRKGASLVVTENGRKMYIFGGHDGTSTLNDIHVLEVERFSWALVGMLGSAPAGRENASASIIGGLLVVAGGRQLLADGGWKVATDAWVAHLAKYAYIFWASPIFSGSGLTMKPVGLSRHHYETVGRSCTQQPRAFHLLMTGAHIRQTGRHLHREKDTIPVRREDASGVHWVTRGSCAAAASVAPSIAHCATPCSASAWLATAAVLAGRHGSRFKTRLGRAPTSAPAAATQQPQASACTASSPTATSG